MSDRLFFGLSAAAAVLMIALALVWPQGLGKRSPWPFGHETAAHAAARAAAAAGRAKPPAPSPGVQLKGPL